MFDTNKKAECLPGSVQPSFAAGVVYSQFDIFENHVIAFLEDISRPYTHQFVKDIRTLSAEREVVLSKLVATLHMKSEACFIN